MLDSFISRIGTRLTTVVTCSHSRLHLLFAISGVLRLRSSSTLCGRRCSPCCGEGTTPGADSVRIGGKSRRECGRPGQCLDVRFSRRLYAGWRQADHLDRAYLGSDVRAVALLVGATMAVAGSLSAIFWCAVSGASPRWPRRSSPCVWCIGRAHEFRLATERRLRNRRDRCRCGHGSSAELQSALSFDWVATSRSFRKTVLCALPRALAAARRDPGWGAPHG